MNVCVPSNSYVESLTPNMMVFGSGALGRELSLDEVVRVVGSPRDGINALIRKERHGDFSPCMQEDQVSIQ